MIHNNWWLVVVGLFIAIVFMLVGLGVGFQANLHRRPASPICACGCGCEGF